MRDLKIDMALPKKQALPHAKSNREGIKMQSLVKLKWAFDSFIISDFLVCVRR